jgi:hypothetical protein
VWVHCSEAGAFADGEVDGSCCPWDERDGRGLVALAEDAQRAMAAFDAEVLDVGGAWSAGEGDQNADSGAPKVATTGVSAAGAIVCTCELLLPER